jgi:hypothetical protein
VKWPPTWELVQFFTGCREDRTRAREAEESLVLEAVAREQLLKTMQAGEDLRCSGL